MYKEQGTKCLICKCEGTKPRKFNLIKTVKQPSCELSNTFANAVVREPHDSEKLFIGNKKKDNVQ